MNRPSGDHVTSVCKPNPNVRRVRVDGRARHLRTTASPGPNADRPPPPDYDQGQAACDDRRRDLVPGDAGHDILRARRRARRGTGGRGRERRRGYREWLDTLILDATALGELRHIARSACKSSSRSFMT